VQARGRSHEDDGAYVMNGIWKAMAEHIEESCSTTVVPTTPTSTTIAASKAGEPTIVKQTSTTIIDAPK